MSGVRDVAKACDNPAMTGVVSLTGLSLIAGTRSLWGTGVLSRTSLGSTKGAVIVKFG